MKYIPRVTRKGIRIIPSSHYVLLSLLFFAGLELIYFINQLAILLSIILFIVLIIGVLLIKLEEGGGFHPAQIILPSLTAITLPSFALFLPIGSWIHLYFMASAVLFFLVLKHGAKKAYPTWNWVLSTIILFVGISTLTALRFYFYIPILMLLPLVFAVIFLISLQSFLRITSTFSEAVLLAGTLSFVLTQAIWVIQWLPIYHIVQAGIVTAFYYVAFHLISTSIERRLERKDVLEYIVVGLVSLLAILLTANWN